MTAAKINAIEYYLPETRLSNEDLCEEFPDWSVDKISAKTGIEPWLLWLCLGLGYGQGAY